MQITHSCMYILKCAYMKSAYIPQGLTPQLLLLSAMVKIPGSTISSDYSHSSMLDQDPITVKICCKSIVLSSFVILLTNK